MFALGLGQPNSDSPTCAAVPAEDVAVRADSSTHQPLDTLSHGLVYEYVNFSNPSGRLPSNLGYYHPVTHDIYAFIKYSRTEYRPTVSYRLATIVSEVDKLCTISLVWSSFFRCLALLKSAYVSSSTSIGRRLLKRIRPASVSFFSR